MSDAFTIQVEPRDPQKNKGTGSRVSRRLRAQGRIPAIVYGHHLPPQPISLSRDDVWTMIRKSARLTQLKIGDSTEMALVKGIQWDHLGKEVIHLDFTRVSAQERVHTVVKLEIFGTAPGLNEGGMLEMLEHDLPIACPAISIPDSIRVEVGGLHLGQSIHVRDLTLPEGVEADTDPDKPLLQIVSRPTAAAEEAADETEGSSDEPEVIGRKSDEEDADSGN